MLRDAISANYRGEYKIEVTFEDGASGIVDFLKYLKKGGVFEKFNDMEFFKNFKIHEELGVLTWGGVKSILHLKHFMLKQQIPPCLSGWIRSRILQQVRSGADAG